MLRQIYSPLNFSPLDLTWLTESQTYLLKSGGEEVVVGVGVVAKTVLLVVGDGRDDDDLGDDEGVGNATERLKSESTKRRLTANKD